MSLIQLISLLRKNLWVIVILPVVTAVAIFFLTRNEKREYNANTLIYTGLASGYTLESGQNSRTDYFATNNAFDNLINIVKSRSTLEEVGIRLLASHLMLRQPTAAVANGATFEHLQQTIPNDVLTQVVDYHSAERTVENIYRYSQIPKNIIAEKLLNAKESPYSVKGILAKLTVNREGTSDMMRISYLAEDPAVVKQTLELVTSVFMRRYREVKVSETGNVVNYFEEQLQKASNKLAGSEEQMKNFSSNNKVINYYEQTKYVSAQDRDIDLEIQKERSELEASKAVLGDLDKKLSMRQGVSLKSQQINTLRDSLSTLNARLTMLEMNPQANQTEVRRVSKQIKSLENRAFEDIGQLYDMNNSKNGVPAKMLFDDWVNAFVGVDKSEARLTVLADIKRKYDRYYGQFAPLGSTMKRLEREIDVAEREYLEILHGLNQSKLREQNLLLSTNLKVLDAPKFPDKPEGSKRLLLIVGGFVVGLVLALVFVLLKEYLKNIFKNVTPTQVVVSTPKVSHSPEKRFVLNRKLGWVMASIAIVIAVAAMGIYAYQLPNETKNNQSVAKPTVAKATPPDTTWDTPSEPTEIQTNTPEIAKSETTFQPVVAQPQPTKTTETLYYVIAGSFKTKAAANQFKQELSQGGYSIQILEPEKEGETYKVAAGIFRNYKAAQDQAESIGFIMDIETTVFKKVI